MFQRDGGGRPLHRGDECEFADQGARAGDNGSATAVIDAKCAALDDKTAIGIVARIEKRVTARNIALLGADCQHAQSRCPQQAQCGDTLKQGNIIFDRHEKPVAR